MLLASLPLAASTPPAGASAPTTEASTSLAVQRPSDHPHAAEATVPSVPEGFSTYDAGWIHFAYHPSIRAKIEPLKAAADQVKAELTDMLGRPVLDEVHVRIARTTGEMQTLAPQGVGYPKYASGVAYSEIGLVLLTEQPRYPNDHHDLLEVFRHELSHIALHDAVGRSNVPRWFNEGFAVYASGEGIATRVQALWTATLAGNLLPLADLTHRFPADATTASVAYAQAADVVRYLLRSHEMHRFRALIGRIGGGQPFEQALSDAYATDLPSLEHEWREDVARRYTFWPVLFSGSTVWMVAIGLFIWGWRRKRRRATATLERWAKEEAAEDRRREALERVAERPVHIVLTSGAELNNPGAAPPLLSRDVPKVEHDGDWHTLH